MKKINSIIIEGELKMLSDICKPQVVTEDSLIIVYPDDENGGNFVNRISNSENYFKYLNKKVRIVGRLSGNNIFIEHIDS